MTIRVPPKAMAKKLARLLRPQHPDYHYLKVEQSLAVYRALALSDVVDEYEVAMQHFPVR